MADPRSGGDNDRRRGTSPACALQDGACRGAPQHGRPGHRRRWVSRLTATIIGVNIATTRRRNGQSWGVGTPAVAACGLVSRRAPTRRAMVHRTTWSRSRDSAEAVLRCSVPSHQSCCAGLHGDGLQRVPALQVTRTDLSSLHIVIRVHSALRVMGAPCMHCYRIATPAPTRGHIGHDPSGPFAGSAARGTRCPCMVRPGGALRHIHTAHP